MGAAIFRFCTQLVYTVTTLLQNQGRIRAVYLPGFLLL
nr:MAG TPA: hypothetical protein [Caudoviricetes sp.]DAN82366.1 MAG TPA: hypothetical protein [Caudoviricetes sp.]DAP11443.1 MAG TPA: hypothetical protein [Caudoviricetes sp.]DAP21018.1 MAG TPA: hypothetical protein [Caudoviricetes sp.]DAY29142.1 MAG TPA: hypothetical protein [Caudoviricetes sp.]